MNLEKYKAMKKDNKKKNCIDIDALIKKKSKKSSNRINRYKYKTRSSRSR